MEKIFGIDRNRKRTYIWQDREIRFDLPGKCVIILRFTTVLFATDVRRVSLVIYGQEQESLSLIVSLVLRTRRETMENVERSS